MANRRGKSGSSDRYPLLGLYNHCWWWLQSWNQKMIASWQESYDKPRQCLKSRDITLLTKVHIVKAVIFPVITYSCRSWTIKKTEHQRIDAFELWCWRWLLKAPWTARRSNQWNPILKAEEGVRAWDGWMASPMQWAWTWANFRRFRGTGRLGVLQAMGSQRAG